MRSDNLYAIPDGLPVPVDDGACDHLIGRRVPPLALPSTAGQEVRLDAQPMRFSVVYAYPRTGVPDKDSPPGWDAIPGARGCTPQACNWRDHHAALGALDATVYGLSTQTTAYQREMALRLHLPYEVLSDESLALTRALDLPTFRYDDWTLLRRHTLILSAGTIVHVVYPVFPSDADADWVIGWLRDQRAST